MQFHTHTHTHTAAVSSAFQAGRDESDKVDEAQAVKDAKARVQVLQMKVCVSIMSPQFFKCLCDL